MVEKKVLELLQDMSARLERIEKKIGGSLVSKDSIKSRIVNTVNDTASITVNQVMSDYSISRPYALEIMKIIEKEVDDLIIIPGNPRNPTVLRRVNVKNKLEYVPLLIIKDLKGRKGATKTVIGIIKQFDLTEQEMSKIVGSVIKHTNGMISLIDEGKQLVSRRFKNWRYL